MNNKQSLKDWYVKKEKCKYDNCFFVEIVAYIRNNETNEIRKYATDIIWDENEHEAETYIWEEGNFSCDCNRHIFFQNVNGEDDENRKCSEDKYSVNLLNPKTNKYFYKEF